MTTGGSDKFAGSGSNYYGSGNVPAAGGGGGDAADPVQTTGIAPIVNNVIQTAFTSGTGSAVNNGAGGAGQGGNGSDPDTVSGGDGGAGYVSDIRGFGTGNETSAQDFIRVDQGLDTNELAPEIGLDSDLLETAFIVEMDYRLGRVKPITVNAPAAVNFIDDDNIASYYLSNNKYKNLSLLKT